MRKLIQSTYIASTINFVSNHESTEKKKNIEFPIYTTMQIIWLKINQIIRM